ncbi:hypothetical protein [Streptomyces sp. NPDC002588]|uniref:hypothetical protein n=1 Tax=Streptomyces sp. NPDC002588 TaxID=3154419 RepID=UPI00332D656C
MHNTRTRLRPGALTACAAALALFTAGCSKASPDAQTGGCRADGHWSGREQAGWLRSAVTFSGTAGGTDPSYEDASVTVRTPRTGDARPLCEPLAVQVEFWTLTTTTAGTETSSVMRYRLATDGGRTRTVGFPSGLPAGREAACVGVLVAVYAGAPLTGAELPRSSPDGDVRFATGRIGAYRLLGPREPAADCAADRPAASASPTGSGKWDVHHP